RLRERTGNLFDFHLREDATVASLMLRLQEVIAGHERYLHEQLRRNRVEVLVGRARFLSPRRLTVRAVDGTSRALEADLVVIATGSRPRTPPEIPVDHEHILDSDSFLSMISLPASLTVLGAGVIASEYASIMAALGVQVTMIDRGPRPLAFLHP